MTHPDRRSASTSVPYSQRIRTRSTRSSDSRDLEVSSVRRPRGGELVDLSEDVR
jgi:hypothetical protein